MRLTNWIFVAGFAGLCALAGCDSDETDDGTGGSASGTGGGGGTTSGTGGTTSGTGGTTSGTGGSTGGTGGTTSSGGGVGGGMGGGGMGGGGMGGDGGQGGGCVDPVAGAPTVTSATAVTLTPEIGSDIYTLVFSEDVNNVASDVTWAGAGTLDGVTAQDAQTYDVAFSGLVPGDTATLSVPVTVDDTCGNPLAAQVDVTITVLAECHLLAEGFETWPPTNWTVVNNAPGAWAQDTGTVHPSGGTPTEGTNLAYFNAWTATAGSTAALESPTLNLSTMTNGVLYFDMYHDTGLSGDADQLQVEYDSGNGWTAIGPAFLRYASTTGWVTEAVDLTSLAGQASVQLRVLATSDYGNDVHIDRVCVQEFTPITCPCPTGGFTETADVGGTSDGNGTLGTAEATSGVLTNATDTVAVCGLLEDDATSGTDYFLFDVAGAATDTYVLTVDYCLEEMLTNATIEIRDGSDIVVASAPAATGQGSFSAVVPGLASYYVVLSEGVTAYPGSTYSVTVTADAILATTSWSEGFENWPPTNLTVVNVSPGVWDQSAGTVHPSGASPTEGTYLAYFNSYTASSGSTSSLESTAQNFTNVAAAALAFDMYHDTSYTSSADRIQVEYDTGNGWTAIGPEFMRYIGWDGWDTHYVDLSSLAGQASVQIRFVAISGYGNDVHIDNALILTP